MVFLLSSFLLLVASGVRFVSLRFGLIMRNLGLSLDQILFDGCILQVVLFELFDLRCWLWGLIFI